MKKKAFSLLLAALLLLGLAACGSGSGTPSTQDSPGGSTSQKDPAQDSTQNDAPANIPEKPSTPVQISVAVAQTGDGFTVLTDAAAAFNASQSDYVVDLYYAGSTTDILTLMQTSTDADRPDIFASSGNDTALYINSSDKIYIPANDFIAAEGYDDSNIVANLRANYQRNGEWQCLPLGNTSVGQYFNTEILSSVGVDAAELTSYQDIYAACQKVADAGYKNFYFLRALTHVDWLNYGLTAQGIEYFDNTNGRGGVPTKCLYDDGGACQTATTAFFQFLRDMLDSDYLLDVTTSADDARIAFGNQEIFFMDGYSSGGNAIISLVDGAFQWDYQVSPVVEAGKESFGQSPGGSALFIAKTGDYWREQGSWEFMKYMMNDEVVCAYAMATGYTPITESGSQTAEYQQYIEEKFPSIAGVIEAQKNTAEGIAYAPVPVANDVNTAYKEICQKMISDSSYSAEDAVAELTSRTNEALELYRISNGL